MDMNELRRLAEATTPQNFDTAEEIIEADGRHYYECPTCGGEGNVEGKEYCNYDNAAVGVQFFYIGDKGKSAEDYYRAANPAAIIELLDELAALKAENEALRAKLERAAEIMECNDPVNHELLFTARQKGE